MAQKITKEQAQEIKDRCNPLPQVLMTYETPKTCQEFFNRIDKLVIDAHNLGILNKYRLFHYATWVPSESVRFELKGKGMGIVVMRADYESALSKELSIRGFKKISEYFRSVVGNVENMTQGILDARNNNIHRDHLAFVSGAGDSWENAVLAKD